MTDMFDSQSSQEIFSQSLLRINAPSSNVENSSNIGSDHWSQTSSQEENLRSYIKRPLLFTKRTAAENGKAANNTRGNRMSFHELQQNRQNDVNQKMMALVMGDVIKQHSMQIKGSLETVSSSVISELKANTEHVNSLISNGKELEKILQLLDDFNVKLGVVENLKTRLQKKDVEISVKDETIRCLEEQMVGLKQSVEANSKRDEEINNQQLDILHKLLLTNDTFANLLQAIRENGNEFKINIDHLLKESLSILEQSRLCLNKGDVCCAELSTLKFQVDDLARTIPQLCESFTVTKQINQERKNFHACQDRSWNNSSHANSDAHFTVQPASRYTTSYIPPLSYISPKPLISRFAAHAYIRQSPTAVVAPRVVDKSSVTVKQEIDHQQSHEKGENVTYKELPQNDIFEVSSDSSDPDSDKIVQHIIPSSVDQKTRKLHPRNNNTKKIQRFTVENSSSKPSTPIQRSIKRYCRVRKSVNVFQDEKCAVRSSRGSLAMKRKQENVFKFEGDDTDIIQFADLLKKKSKKRYTQQH